MKFLLTNDNKDGNNQRWQKRQKAHGLTFRRLAQFASASITQAKKIRRTIRNDWRWINIAHFVKSIPLIRRQNER